MAVSWLCFYHVYGSSGAQVTTWTLGLVLQPSLWLDLHIPFQRQVGLSARVSWSNRWLLEQVWPFPVCLSFTSSLSPHNNPAAVLMVTLSAKPEGIGFLLDTRSQYCTAVDPTALTISPAPSSFFLSLLNVSFLPLYRPRSLCLLYLAPPLITSSVITACWVNSRSSSSSFLPSVFFHHTEIPTMTGRYQLPCINLTQSNLWHLLCYCSSFLCFSVSTNGLPPLYHVLQAMLIVLSLVVSALDVISLTLKEWHPLQFKVLMV